MMTKRVASEGHKDKPLRVQGPRSRAGCQTCKLRHVKCDEATPVCDRCFRSKRTCQYTGSKLSIADTKFVMYTPPNELDSSLRLPPHERRALWHFHQRTVKQIEGPFRSELWSTIIPQLIQNDAIVRQAVLALSAFHESYLDPNSTALRKPEQALACYRKAWRQIIELESPKASFDSILSACIIFCTCEGILGNFEEATQHAVAGMKMIADRRASALSKPSVFTSSENILCNIFLALRAQVMEANADDFQILCPGLDTQMKDVPTHFENVDEALPHLQVLISQIFELYQEAEEHHQIHPWVSSQVAPSLQPGYEEICAKFDVWTKAITRLEGSVNKEDQRQHAGYLLLQVTTSLLDLDLYVFVHGEETYDSFRETIASALDHIETFLRISSATSGSVPASTTADEQKTALSLARGSSLFTSSPGVISILFEVATRTGDAELRHRAIQLLRTSGRREGIWDGRMAANLAEKIVQLKEEGNAAAQMYHPGCKFLVTDILPLSDQRCMVRSGFKPVRPDAFCSFWLESIHPDQGSLHSQIITTT